MTGFAGKLAAAPDVRVLAPTHPGFDGTPRPEALNSVGGLAALYDALLDQLGLQDVTVIGNSIGGWITAEIALLKSPRVSGIVLIDAVGIEVPGHPVADFFSLTMDEVFRLSFHNPGPFRIDPATLPPAAQAIAAGNRAAISVYAGTAMTDPALAGRLGWLEIPALVLWGDSDGIADVDYGRAYAAAIPTARFQRATRHRPLPAAGDTGPGHPCDLGSTAVSPSARAFASHEVKDAAELAVGVSPAGLEFDRGRRRELLRIGGSSSAPLNSSQSTNSHTPYQRSGSTPRLRISSLSSSTVSARPGTPSTPISVLASNAARASSHRRSRAGRTAAALALPVMIETTPPAAAHRHSWLTSGSGWSR